jgi:hypothetical protein
MLVREVETDLLTGKCTEVFAGDTTALNRTLKGWTISLLYFTLAHFTVKRLQGKFRFFPFRILVNFQIKPINP